MKPLLLIIGSIIGAIGFALIQTENELYAEQQNKCEMLQLYVDSDGAYGWPDYDGTFANGYCK